MEHSYLQMIFIMIASGILSSMWVWVDKSSDIRISLNDIYMTGLMTAWMCVFMSLLYKNNKVFLISSIFVIFFYICIRNQLFIGLDQYYSGMIPHHSMAILTSKRLLGTHSELNKEDKEFIKQIIKTQEAEIEWMKNRE